MSEGPTIQEALREMSERDPVAMVDAFNKVIQEAEHDNANLHAENASLRERLAAMQARVQRLEGALRETDKLCSEIQVSLGKLVGLTETELLIEELVRQARAILAEGEAAGE